MFERFTERARQVVVLAQEEARTLHNDHIGVEHILLGCLAEGEGLAFRVLDHLKVSADDLRAHIEADKESLPLSGQMPFTPRAKKVLELALREALSLGHNYIGTEHIALAITRDPGDIVEGFLRETIDDQWHEHVRLEIMEMLRGPRPMKDPDLNQAEKEELKLKDVLADIITGYQMWKDAKQMHEEEWTDVDESFARWMDGSKVSEFL